MEDNYLAKQIEIHRELMAVNLLNMKGLEKVSRKLDMTPLEVADLILDDSEHEANSNYSPHHSSKGDHGIGAHKSPLEDRKMQMESQVPGQQNLSAVASNTDELNDDKISIDEDPETVQRPKRVVPENVGQTLKDQNLLLKQSNNVVKDYLPNFF